MKTEFIKGKIVSPGKVIDGFLEIKDGKIVSVIPWDHKLGPAKFTDYSSCYILPGLIEVHGHMREPGMTQKEDVPHGTKAALAGGVTTIIDMPNVLPPTTTETLLRQKIEKIYPGRSFTDYAFFLGVSKVSMDELEKVDTKTIAGIKVFMAGHETTPTTIPDDKTLAQIFRICAKRNILLAVHAEDQWLINFYKNLFQGISDPSVWSMVRPTVVVTAAAARAIALAEIYDTKVYLLHLSTPEEFALVDSAKKRGVKVFGELVGYQLFFNEDDYKKLGNKIKVAPALRTKSNQDHLWQRVKTGNIDVMCSEHTPHEWESKNQPDVWKAQSGIPGIQETLPAIITEWIIRFGRDSVDDCLMKISNFCAKTPAEIFGFNTKGSIEAGKDADFTIVDINKTWTVKNFDLFSKCGWSSYEGMKLVGRPVATYLRGKLVYQNSKIIGDPSGQWLGGY